MVSRRALIGGAGIAAAGAVGAFAGQVAHSGIAEASVPTYEQGYVAIGLPDGIAGKTYDIGICFTPNFYHSVPHVTLGYYTLDNVNIPTVGRANPFGVTVHVVPIADGPFLAELLWTAKVGS